ncbi:atrial natriuretic peptide receptor 1-like [Paramacrobiotus metropolitanus]|uniref:atrial natriuretic peptide receptor 1-like n=1 Tax=Paramacrobiotus metropolitanus TaxID=2943436 RepID=UPI0024460159|nr:atrial natriuretic peptide receptor 1-like [Paramacrobiotus metropolitanus]
MLQLLSQIITVCAVAISVISGAKKTDSANLTACFIWEDDSYYATYLKLAPALDMGVDHANSFVLPKGWNIQVVYRSSGASCSKTMYSLIPGVYDLLADGVQCDVFLGASCSYTAAALYGFAKKLNVPLLSLPAGGAWTLQDSSLDDFPLLLMPAFGYGDLAEFLISFCDLYNYSNLAIFRDDSYPYYGSMAEPIVRFIKENSPDLFQGTTVLTVRSVGFTRQRYKTLLASANDRARVFLILIHSKGIRELMLAANEIGYTDGDHVFLTIQLYELAYWGRIAPNIGDASDKLAAQAFRHLLLIAFYEQEAPNEENFGRQLRNIARNKYNFVMNPLESIDPIVAGHYEAIMMYASAVTDLYNDSSNTVDYHNGTLLITYMSNTSFTGFEGKTMWIGEDRQRDKDFQVSYFNRASMKFEPFLQYLQHAVDGAKNATFNHVNELMWPRPGGKLPPNEPVCGFRNNKCQTSTLSTPLLATAVVVPLVFVMCIAIGGGILFVKLWKLRLQYNPNWWKIPVEELDVKQNRTASGSKRTLRSHSTAGTGYTSYLVDILASYNGVLVELTDVVDLNKRPDKTLTEELTVMKTVDNGNLQHFIGIALTAQDVCQYIVAELCSKGSLTDVLDNEMLKLDWFFKNSLIRDIVMGMTYIHLSPIHSHGFLTSFTCLVDTRFTLKICDYGLTIFRKASDLLPFRPGDTERSLTKLLWRAPELLRQAMPPKGTQKGDVYSFAIIIQQIILRSGPFELPNDPLELSDKEIIQEIIAANIPPVRPRVPRSSCSNELYDLMERCWEEVPLERPTFPKIREGLKRIMGNIGDNIVDLLFKKMEQYALDLEQKVADQTRQFMDEKNRSEQLLSQLLPKSVAAALTKGITVDPEAFESVTIFFSDIVGFTTIAAKGTPMDVVDLLNSLYTFFDNVLEKFDVYKVETIGDAYMVSSGLPVRNGNRHVTEIASMALDLLTKIESFVVPHRPGERIQIRIGINSGPCVAGIVGLKMPRYCLFGDTVNVASRMESTGEPSRIQIGEETRNLLDNVGGFLIMERGPISVKGKGTMVTHWLLSRTRTTSAPVKKDSSG